MGENPAQREPISIKQAGLGDHNQRRKPRRPSQRQLGSMESNEFLILNLFYRHKLLSAKEIHLSLGHKISLPTVYRTLLRLASKGKLIQLSDRGVWCDMEWWNLVTTIRDARTILSYSIDPFGEGEGIHHYYSQTSRPLITPNLDIDFRPYDPLISYYLIDAPEGSAYMLRNPEISAVFERASYLLYLNVISKFYDSDYNCDAKGRRVLSDGSFDKLRDFEKSIKNGLPGSPTWPDKFSDWMRAENLPGRTFLVLEVNNQRMIELLKSARKARNPA